MGEQRIAGHSKFAPSTARVSPGEKLRETVGLLRDYLGRAREDIDFDWLFADLREYAELLDRYSGLSLSEARLLEIGYGARPYRMLALQSMEIDVRGIDAEQPVLNGSLSEFQAIGRKNGFERLLKTLVRHALFDRRERAAFEVALSQRGLSLYFDESRFLVADAAAVDYGKDRFDLVISEDVFEHIERRSLQGLVAGLAIALRPDGLALIRPNVFTGITGGHLVEWNRRAVSLNPRRRRKSEPWEHLRQKRFRPNTSLNELTRADYRSLFRKHFEILDERVKYPRLGLEFLTPETAPDLRAWPEEELFSNQVLFVLRPLA